MNAPPRKEIPYIVPHHGIRVPSPLRLRRRNRSYDQFIFIRSKRSTANVASSALRSSIELTITLQVDTDSLDAHISSMLFDVDGHVLGTTTPSHR
jgi:hypothetical protein